MNGPDEDPARVHVGTARVLGTEPDGRPRVQLLDGAAEVTTADWALPFRYEPATGDLLLVVGQRGRFWVHGVVHGRGRSMLAFRGDVDLHARGTLRLGAIGGVRLVAPEVRVDGERLEREATTLVTHTDDSDLTVRSDLEERLGSSARTVDGDDERLAGRHSTVAARAVKVDGSLLRLS